MSSLLLILLIGGATGIAFAVADMLIAPVIRGWRTDRREHAAPDGPGTLSTRLLDDIVALGLIGCVVLVFLLVRAL
jgi:hypothetical protein